ncbi:polysaccharide deacetylase family protein [Thalassoglobus sp.]|uniref:polysaccharide deacetylase family protein n=1 Tax=Thalassoglobus sp. TaxID=2795869 RepID=UPI003AA81372
MIAEALGVGLCLGGVGYFSAQYAWWRPVVDWSAPRVLMYHMVRSHRPGTRFNKLRVPPEQLEKQLAWLKARDFHFVFASQLFSSGPLPERSVCLTFDDGYEDNWTNADPLLEKYGACATLYLVTQRDGGWSSKKKAHHKDDELQEEPKLTDGQIHSMVKTGRWELGGHTITHANLATIEDQAATHEIAAAKKELDAEFQVNSQTFAYPFGIYESRHLQMVAAAEYQGAVTTESGIAKRPYADPFQVPRIKVSGTEGLLGFSMRMRGGRRGLFK